MLTAQNESPSMFSLQYKHTWPWSVSAIDSVVKAANFEVDIEEVMFFAMKMLDVH